MLHLGCVATRVLGRGGVAAADVAALGTAPKVEPPPVRCEALDAARATRRAIRIDGVGGPKRHPPHSRTFVESAPFGFGCTSGERRSFQKNVVGTRRPSTL